MKQSSPPNDADKIAPSSLAGWARRASLCFSFQFHEQTRPQNDLSLNIRGRFIMWAWRSHACCTGAAQQLAAAQLNINPGGLWRASALLLFAVARCDRLCSYLSRSAARSLAPSTSDVFSAPIHKSHCGSPTEVLEKGRKLLFRGVNTSLSPSASILLPVSSPPMRFRWIQWCAGCQRLLVVGLFDAFGAYFCSEKRAISCLPCPKVQQQENLFEAERLSGQMELPPLDFCCRAQDVPQRPSEMSNTSRLCMWFCTYWQPRLWEKHKNVCITSHTLQNDNFLDAYYLQKLKLVLLSKAISLLVLVFSHKRFTFPSVGGSLLFLAAHFELVRVPSLCLEYPEFSCIQCADKPLDSL